MGEWKGGERGKGGGKKGAVLSPPQLLLMRRVLKQPEGEDKNEGERQCRRLLKENPQEFFRQMSELEAATAAMKGKAAQAQAKLVPKAGSGEGAEARVPTPAAPVPRDEVTLRVVELIERLMEEFEQEERARSAGTAG